MKRETIAACILAAGVVVLAFWGLNAFAESCDTVAVERHLVNSQYSGLSCADVDRAVALADSHNGKWDTFFKTTGMGFMMTAMAVLQMLALAAVTHYVPVFYRRKFKRLIDGENVQNSSDLNKSRIIGLAIRISATALVFALLYLGNVHLYGFISGA